MILLILAVIAIECVKLYLPSYYDMTKIGITKIPCFLIGVYLGWCAYCGKRITVWYVLAVVLLCGVTWVYKQYDDGIYFNIVSKLVKLPVICALLLYISNWRIGGAVNGMLGWIGRFSLEIYMLHLLIYNVFDILHTPQPWSITLAILLSVALCYPLNCLIARFKQVCPVPSCFHR